MQEHLAQHRNLGVDLDVGPGHPLDASERQLAAGILGFPDVVQEAAASYDPSLIANHCYDLIKAFSSFYQDHPIAKERTPRRVKPALA